VNEEPASEKFRVFRGMNTEAPESGSQKAPWFLRLFTKKELMVIDGY
jgi:hypothetical protein